MIPQPAAANGTPVTAAQDDPTEEAKPHLEFFRQPWVQNVLPFLTSLTVHCVIIVLGIAAAKVIMDHALLPMHQEQTIVPESQVADGPPGGILFQGLHNEPFKQAMQDKIPDGASRDGWTDKPGPKVDLTSPSALGDADASPLAIGPNGVMGSKGGTAGSAGTGDGAGPLAQFGMGPGGGAIGPHGVIFGNGGNAKQIIFVCDASGSMLNKMATLKDELQKAIEGLKPFQSFNVVFFQNQTCAALDRDGMLPATPDNKRKAYTFLDKISPSGTTDPIPGITLAFGQHPELVYLLTDGDFPDNKLVKAKVAEFNHDKKTKVNTVAFVGSSDIEVDFLTLLEQIANDSGGKYRHVNENEVAGQQ